jgi:hypothetical protein
MTSAREILQDAFDRVHELVPEAVGGLTAEQLLWRPDAEANHVAWLVWHLSRVQDDHVAGVAGAEQAWTAGGWSSRFGLPYPDDAIGYGQSSDEVGAFVLADPGLLTGYHEAVHELTRSVLDRLSDEDLSRVVDDSWDPPVTVAIRLVSVVNDIGQHVGQASYVRGLIERRV